MKLETKLVSSLVKIFPDQVGGETISKATVFKNEPFSFQVAFRGESLNDFVKHIYVKIESDLNDSDIAEYLVGNVPVLRADRKNSDDYFERKTPGLYPDMLLKRVTNAVVLDDGKWYLPRWTEQKEDHLLNAIGDSYQTLWFTINENCRNINAGKHNIKVLFFDGSNQECIAEETLELEVIDAELSKQNLIYTTWFHCDCLADTYKVEMFSDKFFEIMRSYVSQAAIHGMNMILLPAFTPPLDTTPGKERRTAQLVNVVCDEKGYSFDFSVMKKYIEICQECGIEYFEHNHLFTQWGAEHAPKIMATVDGEYKRIFGWETDSRSHGYAMFLKSYLKEFKVFLKEMNLEDKIIFHISDEPDIDALEFYENAQKVVGEEIKEYMYGDALSHFEYYEKGFAKIPIVVVNSEDIDKFVEKCDNYWVYYTGDQLTEYSSNRIIPTPSARNRVIGLQMYVGDAKGFLHWGYNYYYGVLSHGLFNPMINPCGYNHLAGTSYLVYPDITGKAIPSLRMKVFYDGLNDYRALQFLESKIGRDKVLDFIEQTVGKVDYKYHPSNKELFEFREKLNNEIIKNI